MSTFSPLLVLFLCWTHLPAISWFSQAHDCLAPLPCHCTNPFLFSFCWSSQSLSEMHPKAPFMGSSVLGLLPQHDHFTFGKPQVQGSSASIPHSCFSHRRNFLHQVLGASDSTLHWLFPTVPHQVSLQSSQASHNSPASYRSQSPAIHILPLTT